MALASGRLRHQVELQEQVQTQDPVTGEILVTWQTIARPWAAIEPLSARDFIAAQAQQSEVRGRITIRRRADINASMRFVHRGMKYQIFGIMPDPVSGLEYMVCMTGEGVRLEP